MEYRKAKLSDFPVIMAIYQAATRHMDEMGIFQWDELYPDEKTIKEDICRAEMYLGLIDGAIASAFTLNREHDKEYANGKWRHGGTHYAVVHRLCVSPDRQNEGIGTQTMRYIAETLRHKGVEDIRLDAFSQNPAALKLYEKLGFQKVGEVPFRKGLFYLFEKRL